MKVRRILYLGGAFLLVLLKFAMDVIAKNVEMGGLGAAIFRELLVAGTFVLLYVVLLPSIGRSDQSPVRKTGLILILTTVVVLISLGTVALSLAGFDAKALQLTPLDYGTLFVASVTSLLLGGFVLVLYLALRSLLLSTHRKGAKRNLVIFSVLCIGASAATVHLRPLDSGVTARIFFWLAVAMAIVNSFRLPWIIELTKREKIFTLIYTFFLFILFTVLNVLTSNSENLVRSLLYFSYPLKHFIQLMIVFGNIYFGMAFVSTLFHLPTAEAFDRKRSEVSSLHTLSRLVTQVFDFNELVDTVTTMTLDVCEAKSSWLEVLHPQAAEGGGLSGDGGFAAADSERKDPGVQMAGMKNIDQGEIDTLLGAGESGIRASVLSSLKPVVVDSLVDDPRFGHLRKTKLGIGSMVVVPLVSHNKPIGLLYATKESEYGFVKDDVDVISAFADQATIAIENSRLIKQSIERERLLREMMLAQEMQKKLLPQQLPEFDTVQIDALSTPAFEVGGDYYDFMHLDKNRLGIIVGDVSGKGVPAAFYMSEVKGIFLALSPMYPSPRDFIVKANDALVASIDKHSFVSLIYAVLDVRTGALRLARAGHCPMLLITRDGVKYIRPNGMGLGLTERALFSEVMEEHAIQLKEGDVCILYTDGVTEARNPADDEYGYERLLGVAQRHKDGTASVIKEEIMKSVREFVGGQVANHDDLTLVVVKWTGNGHVQSTGTA
jgi:sigma-B regulation protein RsbU (phosphoserine phosphatase)